MLKGKFKKKWLAGETTDFFSFIRTQSLSRYQPFPESLVFLALKSDLTKSALKSPGAMARKLAGRLPTVSFVNSALAIVLARIGVALVAAPLTTSPWKKYIYKIKMCRE